MAGGARNAGRDVIDVSGDNNSVVTGASEETRASIPAPARTPSSRGEERWIFVAVDAVGYSKAVVSDQGPIQRDIREIIGAAAVDAGLPYDRWVEQPQGDGVLAMAPLEFEPRYVDDLVAHLHSHLRRRNRDRVPQARLRLRAGMDQGPGAPAANGFTGKAAIAACRLRDASVTRQAIAESGSDLVLAISDQMFHDNVVADRTRVTMAEFTRVEIHDAKADLVGWLWQPPRQVSPGLQDAQRGEPADQN